jgi:uncharacterized 2Fe-2S/4Fe-4S cluster protein (DUF4445 family)
LKTRRLRKTDKQTEFVIAWANENPTKKNIVMTQRDIGEIQLAKAAIFAGSSILMKIQNLNPKELEKVLVAGAFGNYINPTNARLIGLVPDVPTYKIEFVGNAAIEGAKMALLSMEMRKAAEQLSDEIRYVELAMRPEFGKELADALFIPHRDLKRFPSLSKTL